MRQRKPNRHFMEIGVGVAVRKKTGEVSVYVPCDSRPAYWVREKGGDLKPASKPQAMRLERLIGPPPTMCIPEPCKQENPLKPMKRKAEGLQF